MQFLRTIKSWWGLGNNAWSGPTGLDQDLVHIDNHLPNITFTGPIAAGTASAAAPGAAPGVAQLFVDGSYAVTNRDAAGNMAVTAYSPRQGALASNGGDIFICTGASWQSQSAQFERLDQSNKQPGQQQTGYNVQVRETNGIADIFFSDPSGTSNRALLRSSAGAMEIHQYSGSGAYLGRSAYFDASGALNLVRGAAGTGGGGGLRFGASSSNTEGWFSDFNN